jgi:uncharacterized SAM-binding protein YcdF (DUF218 family)
MKIAVILGNRINDDGTTTELMRMRLDLAIKLNQLYNPDKIILSGGFANKKVNKSESSVMYDYLITQGLPQDLLIKEEQSLTTKQNAFYSAKIIRELKADSVILCSSKEHIKRKFLNPVRLFKKQLGKDFNLTVYTND